MKTSAIIVRSARVNRSVPESRRIALKKCHQKKRLKNPQRPYGFQRRAGPTPENPQGPAPKQPNLEDLKQIIAMFKEAGLSIHPEQAQAIRTILNTPVEPPSPSGPGERTAAEIFSVENLSKMFARQRGRFSQEQLQTIHLIARNADIYEFSRPIGAHQFQLLKVPRRAGKYYPRPPLPLVDENSLDRRILRYALGRCCLMEKQAEKARSQKIKEQIDRITEHPNETTLLARLQKFFKNEFSLEELREMLNRCQIRLAGDGKNFTIDLSPNQLHQDARLHISPQRGPRMVEEVDFEETMDYHWFRNNLIEMVNHYLLDDFYQVSISLGGLPLPQIRNAVEKIRKKRANGNGQDYQLPIPPSAKKFQIPKEFLALIPEEKHDVLLQITHKAMADVLNCIRTRMEWGAKNDRNFLDEKDLQFRQFLTEEIRQSEVGHFFDSDQLTRYGHLAYAHVNKSYQDIYAEKKFNAKLHPEDVVNQALAMRLTILPTDQHHTICYVPKDRRDPMRFILTGDTLIGQYYHLRSTGLFREYLKRYLTDHELKLLFDERTSEEKKNDILRKCMPQLRKNLGEDVKDLKTRTLRGQVILDNALDFLKVPLGSELGNSPSISQDHPGLIGLRADIEEFKNSLILLLNWHLFELFGVRNINRFNFEIRRTIAVTERFLEQFKKFHGLKTPNEIALSYRDCALFVHDIWVAYKESRGPETLESHIKLWKRLYHARTLDHLSLLGAIPNEIDPDKLIQTSVFVFDHPNFAESLPEHLRTLIVCYPEDEIHPPQAQWASDFAQLIIRPAIEGMKNLTPKERQEMISSVINVDYIRYLRGRMVAHPITGQSIWVSTQSEINFGDTGGMVPLHNGFLLKNHTRSKLMMQFGWPDERILDLEFGTEPNSRPQFIEHVRAILST